MYFAIIWYIFIRFGTFYKENLATLEKSFVAAISDNFSGCICTLQIVCSRNKVSKFPFEQESRKIAFAMRKGSQNGSYCQREMMAIKGIEHR
jgi:hypothetical protein